MSLNFKKYLNKLKKDLEEKVNGTFLDRLGIIKILFILLFCYSIFAICYRSFFADIFIRKTIKLNSIYDRNNNIMAYNTNAYKVYYDPSKDIDFDISQNELLNLKNIYIDKKKEQKYLLFETEDIEDIKPLKSDCFEIMKYIKRNYPLGKNFSSIGVANLNKGIIKGVENISLNNDVYLTIDMRIQNALANALDSAKRNFLPQECFGIIVNLDGEILGMHTTACTDPENLKDFKNDLIHGLFEYGSTCKIFTFWAGFYFKDFDINTIFNTDEGKQIFDRILHDYEPIPQYSNIFTILSKSSNRGTTAAARKVGASKLLRFFKYDLKLNDPIDIGYTTTIQPKFLKKYKNDDIINMCFGYNFMTNAFNMIRAFLAIFIKGKLLNPTILKNDKRNRVVGYVNMSDKSYQDIIDSMKFTAARHPILKTFSCASKTGTVDRIGKPVYKDGKIVSYYDGKRVNTYIVVAIPDFTGRYKYVMLLGMIDPENYSRAGWNLRETAAEIVRRIYFL